MIFLQFKYKILLNNNYLSCLKKEEENESESNDFFDQPQNSSLIIIQNIEETEQVQDTSAQLTNLKNSQVLKKSTFGMTDITNIFQSTRDSQINENLQNYQKENDQKNENSKSKNKLSLISMSSPNKKNNENCFQEISYGQNISIDQIEDNPKEFEKLFNKSKLNNSMTQNDNQLIIKEVNHKSRRFESEPEYLNHKSALVRGNDSLIDSLLKNCELNDEIIPSFFKWKSYLDEDSSVNSSNSRKKDLSEKEWMNLDAELLHNTFLDNDGYKAGTRDGEVYYKLRDVKINKTLYPSLHRWLKYMNHIKNLYNSISLS